MSLLDCMSHCIEAWSTTIVLLLAMLLLAAPLELSVDCRQFMLVDVTVGALPLLSQDDKPAEEDAEKPQVREWLLLMSWESGFQRMPPLLQEKPKKQGRAAPKPKAAAKKRKVRPLSHICATSH